MSWLAISELVGQHVLLKPLEENHKAALLAAAADGNLWDLWYTGVPSAATIDAYIAQAFNERQLERAWPLVVVHKASGRIIGTTRYCNGDADNHRLEIGFTWYSKSFQRTAVNTECKYLLLQFAFENIQAIAVEFRTHWHNQVSRAAIARLGAKQDGVLRQHQVSAGGVYRDTVVFSILNTEWPAVKQSLEFRLRRN